MRAAFAQISRDAKPDDALVVMLVGHGAFDGVEYKINLKGPDLSAADKGEGPAQWPADLRVQDFPQ